MSQVHEEKRQNWEMEMKEMSNQWESRLRMQQQKTFRMEQALLLQLFKLQQVCSSLSLLYHSPQRLIGPANSLLGLMCHPHKIEPYRCRFPILMYGIQGHRRLSLEWLYLVLILSRF